MCKRRLAKSQENCSRKWKSPDCLTKQVALTASRWIWLSRPNWVAKRRSKSCRRLSPNSKNCVSKFLQPKPNYSSFSTSWCAVNSLFKTLCSIKNWLSFMESLTRLSWSNTRFLWKRSGDRSTWTTTMRQIWLMSASSRPDRFLRSNLQGKSRHNRV